MLQTQTIEPGTLSVLNSLMKISELKQLTYFVDADENEEPITIKPMTWENVKSRISDKVRKFLS